MIIVTGGAGFIGSNIIAEFSKRNAMNLFVCDWFGDGDKWRNVAHHNFTGIINPDELFGLLEQNKGHVEAIFHMGAISATTEKDVDKLVNQNINFTAGLWHYCVENGTRLIYASSAATYGDGALGFDDAQNSEHLSTLRPLNAYGWSKSVVDRNLMRGLEVGYGAPAQWAALKFFNVYGPNEVHKDDMKSVIAKITPDVQAGKTVNLFKSHHPDYEDGGQLRDFVYVKDCVDMIMWLYDNPHVSGMFNIGTGEARSFADLAKSVFASLDKEPEITYSDMPEHLREKYQYFTQADISRLRQAGYSKPMMSLEDGVRDYVQNYLLKDDPYL
jgi:ADP-L-glycero-D-manno-heptose 6-epimerase